VYILSGVQIAQRVASYIMNHLLISVSVVDLLRSGIVSIILCMIDVHVARFNYLPLRVHASMCVLHTAFALRPITHSPEGFAYLIGVQ